MKKLLLLIIFTISSISESLALPDYVEKEIWNDSWPIYASEFYNGKQYSVQIYRKNNKNKDYELRLLELDINSDATLSDSGKHWVLKKGTEDGSGDFSYHMYNAAMAEKDGKLYILFRNGTDYHFFSLTHDEIAGDRVLTELKCPMKCEIPEYRTWNFCMTKYRKSLMIFSSGSEWANGKVRVVYTEDDPSNPNAEWKDCNTRKIFDEDTGMWSYGFNDFTVTNWVGVRNDENGVPALTEELIFAQYLSHKGIIEVHHFNGDPEHLNEKNQDNAKYVDKGRKYVSGLLSADKNDAKTGYGLKAVCGQIVNVGSANDAGNINNPIQFILAFRKKYVTGNIHQRQIMCYEYNPEKKSFAQNTKDKTYNLATNLPYGKFGACVVSVPIDGITKERVNENDEFVPDENGDIDVTTYQRYISILSGSCYDNHFSNHHYYAMLKSNQLKVKKGEVNTTELVKSKEGRRICTLVGVIEGAPPTVIDNEKMYESLIAQVGDGVSFIELTKEEENSISSETSNKWGYTNIAGFDNYAGGMLNLATFSVMGGGGYEVTKTTKETTTTKKTFVKTISNSCEMDAITGIYLYLVPLLDQYVGTIYTPDGSRWLEGTGGICTFVQTGSMTSINKYKLNGSTIDSRLRVDNPLKLESWKDRCNVLFKDAGTPIFGREEMVEADTGISESIKNTKSSSYTCSKESNWEFLAKTHFYQNKSNGYVKWTSKTESTVGGGVKYGIKKISFNRWNLEERDEPIEQYQLEAYLFNNADNPTAKIYYDDLISRGYMYKEDRPFILAWNVRRINTYKGDDDFLESPGSGVEEIASDKDITAAGGIGCVEVICRQKQKIEIYSLAGVTMFSAMCPEGINEISLPPGIYIVGNGRSTIKVAIK